jgi:hypothetical protein
MRETFHFRQWNELTINEKIFIKQYAMSISGKRWHIRKPILQIDELNIHMLLTQIIINSKN